MRYRLRTPVQFTVRDLLWLMVLVGFVAAWSVDRRNYTDLYRAALASHANLQDEAWIQVRAANEKSRLLQEDLAKKQEEAVNRELDLKTTVRALKLRLGDDPYGK